VIKTGEWSEDTSKHDLLQRILGEYPL
jgi:hypothetical protein